MADLEWANNVFRYDVTSDKRVTLVYVDRESPNRFEFYEHFIDLAFDR